MQLINPKLLTENLDLLFAIDPELVQCILEEGKPKHLEFIKTSLGELNLAYNKNDQSFYLHSEKGAIEEANNWINSLLLEEEKIGSLFIFGCGLGYYYPALESWIEKKGVITLTIIENDPAIFSCFLQTEIATKMIENPKVDFIYFQDTDAGWKKILETVAMYTPYPNKFAGLPCYQKHYPDLTRRLSECLLEESSRMSTVFSEFFTLTNSIVTNVINNAFSLPDNYRGNDLYGKFNQIPAIICGAGPSLNKNIEQLKTLGTKSIIFAGSSALNALSARSIQPHFGIYLDAFERVYERYLGTTNFETPIFFSWRVFYRLVNALHSPRLHLNSTTNYPMIAWLEEQLGIGAGEIYEGLSVICLTTKLATFLGCNPIIYVGLDLAYTDNQRYTSGIRNGLLPRNEQEEKNATIEKKDIFNHPITTNRHWIEESRWLGSFIKNQTGKTYINATEGGLGIAGVPNVSLKEVSCGYLKNSYPIRQMVHSEILNTKIEGIETKQIFQELHKVSKSFKSCNKYYKQILKEFDHIYKCIEKGKELPDNLRTKKLGILEDNLVQELAYQKFLERISFVSNLLRKRETKTGRYLPNNQFRTVKQILKWKSLHQQFVNLEIASQFYSQLLQFHLKQKYVDGKRYH